MRRGEQTRATKRQITEYLNRHPAAADTARGIQRWWLMAAEIDETVINQALDELQREGLVTRNVLADGTIVFSAVHRGDARGTRKG